MAEQNVWQQTLSKAQAVSVQNVMNPLLWLNAVAIPVLLVAAYVFRTDLIMSRSLAVAAAFIPLWTLREYSCWRRDNPSRLHSERFLIEHQQLMIHSKNTSVPVAASTLPSSDNPESALGYVDNIPKNSPPVTGMQDDGDDNYNG